MGNNSAYGHFEEITIGAYDLGKLDKPLMDVIGKAFANVDIDSGGSCDLQSKDGKNINQVVIEAMGGTYPDRPILPKAMKQWTPEHDAQNEAFHEAVYNALKPFESKWDW